MFTPPVEASEKHYAYQPVSMQNLGKVRYDPFSNYDNLLLSNEDEAVSEMVHYKKAGGGTVIEATTIGIGRDPHGLARIARATGINIVMGAGYYVSITHPEGMNNKTESEITRQIVEEITVGIGDTGIKAGIIGELGCSWPLEDNEHKVLTSAAYAQKETGASILIHPGRDEAAPFEILDILGNGGADLSRVIIGHLDRTIFDGETLLRLAERGSYLEYDLFGWETSYYPLSIHDMITDSRRLDYIQLLLSKGYGDRIVMAHDVFGKHRWVQYGGTGYAHILENIVPRMRDRGISGEDIEKILVGNPTKILTLV
jgi:phosphotriesterase-related protein